MGVSTVALLLVTVLLHSPLCSIGLYVGVSTLVLLVVTLFCFSLLCVLKSKRFKAPREPIQLVLSAEDGVLVMEKEKVAQDASLPHFTDPMEFPRENITFMDTVLGKNAVALFKTQCVLQVLYCCKYYIL